MIKLLLVLIVLGLGLYFIAMNCRTINVENFDSENEITERCPNMLIEHENMYFLYNSKMAIVPGVNPIMFKNLEDYTQFIQWQRGQGINCPVLHLQYTTDPQNTGAYIIRSNIFDNQGGLPNDGSGLDNQPEGISCNGFSQVFDANSDDPPFNIGGGAFSYDPENQYIGLKTPIDLIGTQGTGTPNPIRINNRGSNFAKRQIGDPLINNSQGNTQRESVDRSRHSRLNRLQDVNMARIFQTRNRDLRDFRKQ